MLGEKQTGRLAGWLDGGDGCMNGQTDRQSYYFCSRLFSMQPNGAWHRVPAAKYLSTDCGFCYVVHFFYISPWHANIMKKKRETEPKCSNMEQEQQQPQYLSYARRIQRLLFFICLFVVVVIMRPLKTHFRCLSFTSVLADVLFLSFLYHFFFCLMLMDILFCRHAYVICHQMLTILKGGYHIKEMVFLELEDWRILWTKEKKYELFQKKCVESYCTGGFRALHSKLATEERFGIIIPQLRIIHLIKEIWYTYN